jgi:protein-S-isoprenylcysteine O-methyltransferase Ste14
MTTAYMLSAIRWEENDLVKTFGEKYIRYKQNAPMLIPFTKRKAKVFENPQTISD